MKRREMSHKSIIMTALAFVFCLAAILFMFTLKNIQRISRDNREYLTDSTSQTAKQIDEAIAEGYDNIKMLSTLVSRSLTGPEFDIAVMQDVIKDSVFDFMEFADRDGRDHNITGGISDARDRQYYLDARAGNSGMELILVSRATHETLLMFYSPVYYEDEFVGSLVGVYQTANRITRLLSATFFGEPSTTYLATDTGRIIASNLGFDPQTEMYVRDIADGDVRLEAGLEEALKTGSTATLTSEKYPAGLCMQRLGQSGWYIIQIFPEQANSSMITAANRLGYITVGLLVVLCLAVVIFLVRFYRKQREAVQSARLQAEQANRAKTVFLFNMSHDIRTPMNAILGYTDIALHHIGETEKVNDSLQKIKSSGNHLLQLINDILEMSRIESGKLEITEEPLDIRDAINEVSQMSRILADKKNIDFNAVTGEIKNPYIMADVLHINEVIINLISNAIKYTHEGGRVEYRAEQPGEAKDGRASFRFTVSDNGMGMSEEFQRHLFESFSRENAATVSRQEGTGLGLAIVKQILDMMGGTIRVQSEQGSGSVFTVEIPFAVMDEATEKEFRFGRRQDDPGARRVSMEGKRVLLVDDNEMNLEIASELLREIGIEVDTADDGVTAVKKAAENGAEYYDYILMDIQMRVMNGYEATVEIRKLPGGDRVPIIALSANAFKEDIEKSLANGMNAHVAKPVDIKVLAYTMCSLAK